MKRTHLNKATVWIFLCLLPLAGLEAKPNRRGKFQTLPSSENGIYKSLNPESDELVITFTGLASQMGISIHEFKNMLITFDVNIFFVSDSQQNFYQYGLEPNGNITQALGQIKKEIDLLNPKKIVIFGNSAGGYAALLFGFLLLNDGYPVKQVHAFSPKNKVKTEHRDYPNIEPAFFHLKNVFSGGIVPADVFHVYYAINNRKDVKYALTHLDFDWIKHYRFKKGGHAAIVNLKEEGVLQKIMKRALEEDLE